MPADSAEPIAVVAVGDVQLDRDTPETAFAKVLPRFEAADLVMANLEGPMSTHDVRHRMDKGGAHLSPPEMVHGLTAAGIDLVSLANNHTMDFEARALSDTIDLLEEHGIGFAGGGRNEEEAERVAVETIDGVRFGMVSFEATGLTWQSMEAGPEEPGINLIKVHPQYPEPHVSDYAFEKLRAQIAEASVAVDVLFVMAHFGVSMDHTVVPAQRALATAAIDAGADAVVGHHPHVLQAIDVHDGAPIFYSTSNFVFDDDPGMLHLPRARMTGVVEFGVDPGEPAITEASFTPMAIDAEGNPDFVDPESEEFGEIARVSGRDGVELVEEGDRFRIPL